MKNRIDGHANLQLFNLTFYTSGVIIYTESEEIKMSKITISVYCPHCGWHKPATWWDVDRRDDGSIYPIIVCPECYHHLELAYP